VANVNIKKEQSPQNFGKAKVTEFDYQQNNGKKKLMLTFKKKDLQKIRGL
jgi:hypothetical protein